MNALLILQLRKRVKLSKLSEEFKRMKSLRISKQNPLIMETVTSLLFNGSADAQLQKKCEHKRKFVMKLTEFLHYRIALEMFVLHKLNNS